MFKRENVDIEFLGGRLIYMGDWYNIRL
jgi:hypothetical protein